MKHLTMTVAAIALTAGGAAFAQSADDTAPQTHDNMEQAETNLSQAGENLEQAAEDAGNAIEHSAEQTGDAMHNAANNLEGEMDEAGNDTQALFANDADGLIRARDILGGTVYAEAEDMEGDEATMDSAATDSTAMPESGTATLTTEGTEAGTDMAATGNSAIDENWNSVGEIEDLVFNADGSLEGVVAEVGGFLGLGDKHIHVSLGDMNLVPVDDASYAIVVPYTKDQMMEMPDVDESFSN
ncbi:PRC-barrel domain-containing protein [Salipiger sp. 1_MG-2023]|uniref:PRC-barrel domain-containing protein n=1 Tax=Salipiger sp. 1_MG-2023 TaxID=3062665 RepID=UPI0026E25C46|nr:PRC-barrel domain-containing protein [Salipiger sp. 1_MG-2023]MDO6585484.1 PRC-barrel domain-containing protein [Salipiger sp. 1_MG-2023]